MKRLLATILLLSGMLLTCPFPAAAQDLTISTVNRPPFSMVENGTEAGFSMDLLKAISEDLGWQYRVVRAEKFSDMLDMVQQGEVDAAIANISITAARELLMDFSQPIFESGLQIMTASERSRSFSMLSVIFSPQLIGAILVAFALLFLAGMAMWALERHKQPYFDKPVREAMFPSFWWALNLIVNGGFEERMPRSFLGRIFSVVMVVGSLFIVSIFVARITAAMTIDAIQSNVNSISDLAGKQVATIDGSTASTFLASRNLSFVNYPGLQEMLNGFEAGEVDAVVFDAPILAYYVLNSGGKAQLAGSVIQRENYGIALPSGSALAEPINQSLLRLRENGTYGEIYRKWFGALPGE